MSESANESSVINEKAPLSVKEVSNTAFEKADKKNILLRDIEMDAIKEALITEIDVSKLKATLIADIKATLLKEIDVSVIRDALTKEIDVSDVKSALTKEIDIKDFLSMKAKPEVELLKGKVERVGEKNKKQKIKEEVALVKVNLPAYKYGLTESLIQDHEELLSIHQSIMESAINKDYALLPLMISNFSKVCVRHFGEEESLYVYMKALAGSRSEIEKKVVSEFSSEMRNIELALFTMLNQSSFIPVTDNSVDGFIREFGEVGEILVKRIQREEKILYPMYENSRRVVDIC